MNETQIAEFEAWCQERAQLLGRRWDREVTSALNQIARVAQPGRQPRRDRYAEPHPGRRTPVYPSPDHTYFYFHTRVRLPEHTA